MRRSRLLLVLFTIAAGASFSATPVFDERMAQRWALAALSAPVAKNATTAELKQALSSSTAHAFEPLKGASIKRIDDAFALLQACRVARSHDDLSLTAAERYMYMRLRTAETGDANYRKAPALYLSAKRKKIADGTIKELQTTDQPVSPPSEDVRRWGELGADHGLKDHTRLTGKEPPPGVQAAAEGLAFVLGSKYGYCVAEKRPCKLQLP